MQVEIKRWGNGETILLGEYKSVKDALEKNKDTVDFSYAELNGAELNYAKLIGAKLNHAELNGAELIGAELIDAELNYAELNHAKLIGAKLNHAELNGAELNYAKLIGAKLNHAELNGAELNHAELIGADIDFSAWPLWCGSKDVIVDRSIFLQLLAHICAVKVDDDECLGAQNALMDLAIQSHRAKALGLL